MTFSIKIKILIAVYLFIDKAESKGSRALVDHNLSISPRHEQLKTVLNLLINEAAEKSKCLVTIYDTYYRRKIDTRQPKSKDILPIYRIFIRENEEFSPPRRRLKLLLENSKTYGCDVYVIMMTNGLQVSELLIQIEEDRLINAQGKFILMFDYRLFPPEMKFLWNRLINVVFLKHNVEFKRSNKKLKMKEWYDLFTVSFPVRVKGFVVTYYLDTWYKNRFRYGSNHFKSKTEDLKGRKIKVAVFEHIPAVTDDAHDYFNDEEALKRKFKFLGLEFEMLLVIAKVLNFKPEFYLPENVATERWGDVSSNSSTGIFGEVADKKATFYLADLYYTMDHLKLLDLSRPYNVECLTFLTLESLAENSWKLLILPFQLYTWIALILATFFCGIIIYIIAIIFTKYIGNVKEDVTINSTELFKPSSAIQEEMKEYEEKEKERVEFLKYQMGGLYLFNEIQNSLLYTFGMLMQVSIPVIPNTWSVRIFIGWWWIFAILMAVTYKAKMTATLANAIERVTIDTLAELVETPIPVGGWGEENKQFFLNSSDEDSKKLGGKFHIIIDQDDAIAAVSNGTLNYYENEFVLQRERVKRQILEEEMLKNSPEEAMKAQDHNLHVMEECIVNVPVSIGMDKNSPLKKRVDYIILKMIEAGFTEKWLSDVKQETKVLELSQEGGSQKALIDLTKLQSGFIAVAVGFLISLCVLLGELLHWHYIVLKDPDYNKYRLDEYYKKKKIKNKLPES